MTEQDLKKQLELHSIIEFSNLINSKLDQDFILNYILLSVMGRMMITRGMILMKYGSDTDAEKYIVKCAKGLSNGIQGSVLDIKLPSHADFTIEDFSTPPDLFVKNGLRNFFKIYYTNKLLGILCLGGKNNNAAFENSEIVFIETILNISSISIENTLKFEQIINLNKDLTNKVTKLNSLFELSKVFYSNFEDKAKIIKLLNYTLLGNYGIREIIIFSKYRAKEYFILSQTKNYNITSIDNDLLQSLKDHLLLTGNTNFTLFDELYNEGLRLAIPIFKNGDLPETVVFLGNKLNGTPFQKSDIEFLTSLVNLSVISIENSILFKEHLEKLSLENELKIAHEIQTALLPKEIPQPEHYSISAVNKPALHVGGDYFDIIRLTDSKFAIVIADVSGKGAPAALLMSNLQSAVRSYIKVFNESIDISLVTKKINELIFESTSPEKFITFFWGILDTEKNSFKFVNAGHNYPLVFRNSGSIEKLEKGGMIIGILFENIEYESGNIEIGKDDVLVFYTDGINEAKSRQNEEYEMERFREIVLKNKTKNTDEITSAILNDVEKFTEGELQSDDQTLIVIKKLN
ncbi:MAG TPA: PP2C family protein-serine/threonine phosphatase [Ignavibacteria bacterium]|nr:PP2C family protein-serine/threonine phosphatase [Ignavibacteria bacterium]